MTTYGGNLGGSMELGETVYETACREVKEESGLNIDIQDLSIFGIYSGESQRHIYPNGDEVYMVNIVLQTRTYSGNLRESSESQELCFFNLDNLPSQVTRPFQDVKNDLLQLQRQAKPSPAS